MRTYRDAIKDSTDFISFDGGKEMLAMPFPGLLRSFALILILDSQMRLAQTYPDMEIDGYRFEGKAKTSPTADDVIDVLHGIDKLRSMGQFMQLEGFLTWFLEQECDEDWEGPGLWYSETHMLKLWNEYAAVRNKEAEE